MNKGIISIVLIIGISALTSFGIIKYMPISWLDSNDNLGTSVTTISTATKFSDFPGIYNTDMAALNTGKMEKSTTTLYEVTTASSLVTVGALSSGSLTTGFTAVPVSLNGTGTTSPSQWQVILGNGAYGLTIASSTGTSGQFLTSAGAGAYPSWQTSSVNQSDDYNWTGTSLFTDFRASSTVYLNGIDYSFPALEGASSTVLMTGGTGTLTWNQAGWDEIGTYVVTSATSSMEITGIPARKDLKIIISVLGVATADKPYLQFNLDSGSNYGFKVFEDNVLQITSSGAANINFIESAATTSPMYIEMTVGNSTAIRKLFDWSGSANAGTTQAPKLLSGAGVWNNTDQVSSVYVVSGNNAYNFTVGSRISVYSSRN